MEIMFEAFGVLGIICLLGAFYINNKKRKIARRTKVYNGLNFVGAIILGIYAYLTGAWIFALLNLIWALIALRFLLILASEERGHADLDLMLK